ncbi:MAG: BPSS1780 family membrane protein [Gammaproteobacteria bacterium]
MTTTTMGPGKQAWSWYKAGWRLFLINPSTWILYTFLWVLLGIFLWQIPILGRVAWWMINPALYAGFLYQAAEMEQGRPLAARRFFIGLTDKTKRLPLLMLGVITLAAYVFLNVVAMVDPSLYTTIESLLRADASTGIVAIEINLLLRSVLLFMILALATMALLYSCPAIMFAGSDAFDAMMNSFETCARHWRAFAAFMGIFIILAIAAMIPMGLGFLVLIPVTFCAAYASFQTLYGSAQPDSNAPG